MKTVFLLRHGHSVANSLNLVNGTPDDPLTERGRRQAVEAGKLFAVSGVQFDTCVVSQWRRAQETAEIALPNERFVVDNRIGETDPGLAAGLTFEELPQKYPEFTLPFDPLRPYPGGESHQQLYERSIKWFIETTFAMPSDSALLAVSHGGPICSILQYVCKVDMQYFPMFVPANATLSKVTLDEEAQWTLCYFSMHGSTLVSSI